jgi:hypothetical protein
LCDKSIAEVVRGCIAKGWKEYLAENRLPPTPEPTMGEMVEKIPKETIPAKVRPGPQNQVFAKTGYDEIDPTMTKAR